MSRFFRRIFLSVWAVLFATVGLTLFVVSLLPQQTEEGESYVKQLVGIVAADLRDALAVDREAAIRYIKEHHVLDFDNLLQIYVVDPNGDDVYGRALPFAVKQSLPSLTAINDDPAGYKDPRVWIHQVNLDGFQVVGFQQVFPLGRALVRPGARPLLLTVALIMSGLVSFVLARFIVIPIRRLREAGQRVAEGDLNVRVAHTVGDRTDDIAQLARDFDNMTGRIEQLLNNQQRLMRDVSHELRSPLARLQALLSIARQKNIDQSLVDRMERETERLNGLIEQILTYARMETNAELQLRDTDLVDLLTTIAEDASVEGEIQNKSVTLKGSERLLLRADHAILHSVFENLVRNAVRHTVPASTVVIEIKESASKVTIAVKDSGPGVPEGALNQLFEPFFQVDGGSSSEGGSGVGLAIAEQGALLHGGRVWAENAASGGLIVCVELPLGSV